MITPEELKELEYHYKRERLEYLQQRRELRKKKEFVDSLKRKLEKAFATLCDDR